MSNLPLQASLNLLISGLSPRDRSALTSVMAIERPPQLRVLNRHADGVGQVCFPLSGVVGLTVTDTEGRHVQTALVGPEGCTGLDALFSQGSVRMDAMVQVPGEIAFISETALRPILETHPTIYAALARWLYDLSAQSLQTIACNRLHSLEARCCRWLLMLNDRTGMADLPLTQESLAMILGSGRPRVNQLLAAFARAGLVELSRGRIKLLNRPGLERRSCECYRLIPYPPRW